MTTSFQYCDPHAEPGAAIDRYEPRLARDAKSPRIALFPNLFTDSVEFLQDLARPLATLLPGAQFGQYDKKFLRSMSVPASRELIQKIATECRAAVLAFGHCGSCTCGVVQDAVQLARAGVPVVALITTRFADEARFLARALGLPGIPFVFLPHPVAGRDAEFHRALAGHIAPAVVAALTDAVGTDAAEFRALAA